MLTCLSTFVSHAHFIALLRSDDTSLTGTMPPEICVLRSISLAELTAALCGRFECGCCGGNIHVACCP